MKRMQRGQTMSDLIWMAVGFLLCLALYERQRLKAFVTWLRSKPWEDGK